jgi:predicted permease
MFVSANWFQELGFDAARGRVFREGVDDQPDAAPAVVVSHKFWEQRLGSDPIVVGRTIHVNDRAATLVGVAPAGFPGVRYDNTAIWIPVAQIDYFTPGNRLKDSWDESTFLYARLQRGVSPAAATDSLRAVFEDLSLERPELFQRSDWLQAFEGRSNFRAPAEFQRDLLPWVALNALVFLILVIVCANLGNLMLSRSIGRLRELSLRVALGAGRLRVVRYLLAESLILALVGAMASLLFAYWGLKSFAGMPDMPQLPLGAMDWRLTTATLASMVLVTVAIGLFPSLRISRQNLIAVMKDGGHQASVSLQRTPLRSTLVAVQVAGSCILLMLAGLFVRAFDRLHADPGYDVAPLAVLTLNSDRPAKGDAVRTYWTAVRDAIGVHPGAANAALVSHAPLGSNVWKSSPSADAPGMWIAMNEVDPSFFDAMGIRVLAGRSFTKEDGPGFVIVSRRLATALYDSVNVIGRSFPKSKPKYTIVGVVEDARVATLDDSRGAQAYFPINWNEDRPRALVVRARGQVENLIALLKNTARSYDGRAVPEVRLLQSRYDEIVADRRTFTAVATGLASLSLALASLGIFGVVSYGASVRRKEIGIRLALGASRASVFKCLGDPLLAPVLLATVAGLGGGFVLTKIVESQNPGTSNLIAVDPLLFAGVVLMVAVCVVAAITAPTVRASRTDVVEALRCT